MPQGATSTHARSTDGLPQGHGPPLRLRLIALRRLVNLMEDGGEMPWDGSPGVLLPPLSVGFFSDELGCLPAEAEELLNTLVEEGLLADDGARYRVPVPEALREAGVG